MKSQGICDIKSTEYRHCLLVYIPLVRVTYVTSDCDQLVIQELLLDFPSDSTSFHGKD